MQSDGQSLRYDRRWRAGTSCVVTIAEIVAWMIPDFFPMVLGILNGQGSTLTYGMGYMWIGGALK